MLLGTGLGSHLATEKGIFPETDWRKGICYKRKLRAPASWGSFSPTLVCFTFLDVALRPSQAEQLYFLISFMSCTL